MKMVFIGDSLTEFFDWQERFPMHEVGNYGIAGETAEELYERMPLLRAKAAGAKYCFVMTGANNVAIGNYEIAESVRGITRTIVPWDTECLAVLQSVLPMILPWVDNKRTEGLNREIERIANETGAYYLDVSGGFFRGGMVRHDCLLDDGVHLSEEGYRVWSDAVEGFIRSRQAL